ncbi:MAG TPA: ABC transporter permease [Polyangia bacterium]|jgi:ABC-type polysaccharide/polyol phosphate export permease|nr:ABC transporter permease [Polyangia bacterium]
MRALPDVWVHRRPAGPSWGPLDDESPSAAKLKAPRTTGWHVLSVLLRNEFRARYRSQALGILWSLLNPLVQTAILSVIFSHVSAFKSAIPHFAVYLLIGVVVWQWFATAINTATQSFISNADIVKRTVFSRQIIPLSTAMSYGINFAMEGLLVLALVAVWPHAFKLSWALVLVPVILAILSALIVGIVLATSVLNVIYRDVAFLVSTALTLLYWLCPIIYPLSFVPPAYLPFYQMNPIASILVALRGCIMDGAFPSALTWAGMLGPTALMLAVGWVIFRHYELMVLDYV